jgi:drug/metabolite transporter (DMT)-like permease
MDKRSQLGYALAGVFVFLSAGRDLFGYLTLLRAPVHATIFASFAATVIVAQSWNYIRPNKANQSANASGLIKDTIFLNLTTLVSWVSTFEGLARLLPTTLAAITVGGIPISTLLLDYLLRGKRASLRSMVDAIVIIAGMIVMSWREFNLETPSHSHESIVIGIGFSLLAAAFAAANNVFAKRINERGFTGTQVFASRFWLLLAACVVWCILDYRTLPRSGVEWVQLTCLGALGIALPVICLQLSIERIGPKIVGFVIATIPVLVAFGEIIFHKYLDRNNTISMSLGFGVILVVAGITRELLPQTRKTEQSC